VLEGLSPEYRFHSAEHKFGFSWADQPSLVVEVPGRGKFQIHGFIDRVDRDRSGNLRIVDYKTGGPSGFDNRSVREGKKLQLPLYALAAERVLDLGKVQEGFYFHLQAAQPSSFQLSTFSYRDKEGTEAAVEAAAEHGLSAIEGIRRGEFAPRAPDGGCPSYCPAVEFCWKYQPRYW
jgi:ATP-dependent helicase/DNAse subunit B